LPSRLLSVNLGYCFYAAQHIAVPSYLFAHLQSKASKHWSPLLPYLHAHTHTRTHIRTHAHTHTHSPKWLSPPSVPFPPSLMYISPSTMHTHSLSVSIFFMILPKSKIRHTYVCFRPGHSTWALALPRADHVCTTIHHLVSIQSVHRLHPCISSTKSGYLLSLQSGGKILHALWRERML